jgi:hypothetical protein
VLTDYIRQLRRRQAGEAASQHVQFSVPQLFDALEATKEIKPAVRRLAERHFMDRERELSATELEAILPLLRNFQERAATRQRLYEQRMDSRRPPQGRAASLLGHLTGSDINSISPVGRAELLRRQNSHVTIKHDEDDKRIAYGLQWLLMKPQPYTS